MKDQITDYPLWVSYSSILDFLNCSRSYYLKHIYKDPNTGNKINIINPHLALGLVVHDVLESLSLLKRDERFKIPLIDKYYLSWEKVKGEQGGFRDLIEENKFKERGKLMIERVVKNPGPILNKTVKLLSPDKLPPRYLLSKKENILLCGKVDWLEYLPEDNSIHIIDFKTGIKEEKENSLQLPIYGLLVKNCQSRNIRKMSYWYLGKDDFPTEMKLPDFKESEKMVLEIALHIKGSRKDGTFTCQKDGCFFCEPFEAIIKKRAKYIRSNGYQDIYIINN